MRKLGVGLQLYSIRDDLRSDLPGTLRRVRDMGYPAVQLFGWAGLDAAELKPALDGLGLSVAGNHVSIGRLESALDEEIDLALTLGTPDVICPALPSDRRGSIDDFRHFASLFNSIGKRCAERGARFHYHNHAFEFQKFDGVYAMDRLLEWTDPSLVFFEPDVYWIHIGGADPIAYIQKCAGRVPYIHIKDYAPSRDPAYAEIGEGTLDMAAIFAASEAAGAEWYVVEQDASTRPMMESVEISVRNLRKFGKL
ncbi:MAG: sugar phosphate isomerase/epimerase [Chloroflexota bacterium]|nr:MAG: sugar phosphate isomerase/epimerase [Chloroflexota bacterium]